MDWEPMSMKMRMKNVAGFHSLAFASWGGLAVESDRRRNLGIIEYQNEGWMIRGRELEEAGRAWMVRKRRGGVLGRRSGVCLHAEQMYLVENVRTGVREENNDIACLVEAMLN